MIDDFIQVYIVPLTVRVVVALITAGVGWLLLRWGMRSLERVLKRTNLDEIAIRFVSIIARVGILSLIALFVLAELGVDTTALVAAFGAISIALGLALQDTIKHFASGIVLVLFHPFRAGDFVEAAGQQGFIEQITLYSTTLRTVDNKEVIVPNANVADDTIVNYAARPIRRLDMTIGIGYEDDLALARALIEQALKADTRILTDPAPQIALDALADSNLSIIVRPWVNKDDYWDVKWKFLERIKTAFAVNHISIPYPQMQVHLDTAPQMPT